MNNHTNITFIKEITVSLIHHIKDMPLRDRWQAGNPEVSGAHFDKLNAALRDLLLRVLSDSEGIVSKCPDIRNVLPYRTYTQASFPDRKATNSRR